MDSDNRIIDRPEIKDPLDRFAEEGGDRKVLNDLADICRKDNKILADKDLMHALLDAAKGKEARIIGLVAHFVKGHIRASQNLRQTGREMVIHITGMKESSFYSDKSPLDLNFTGDRELTDKDKVALYVIGPAFLEDTEYPKITPLGQQWNEAARVSFAEECGIADNHLFSLGRWYTSLALNCRDTLKPKEAEIILTNILRINAIVDEHHTHSVRIPEFLYELSGIKKPSNDTAPAP